MNKGVDLYSANRIAVIGCPGAGKTMFSTSLNQLLNKPLYHLDLLYWKNNWQRTENVKWDELVKLLSEQSDWIIDGNYIDTLEIRIKHADIIILLDYNTSHCLINSFKRLFNWEKSCEKSYQNQQKLTKPSLKQQLKLCGLIIKFKHLQRPKIYKMLYSSQKRFLVFTNRKQSKIFLNELYQQKKFILNTL